MHFLCFWAYVGQPHDHRDWATSMPFASINPTNPRTNLRNFRGKILRIDGFDNLTFFWKAILIFFFCKKMFFFFSYPMEETLRKGPFKRHWIMDCYVPHEVTKNLVLKNYRRMVAFWFCSFIKWTLNCRVNSISCMPS